MPTDLEQLLDMGFPKPKAQKAVRMTNGSGLQAAMDWLIEHENEEVTEEEEEAASKNAEDAEPVAKSYKCEECGKCLRTEEDVEVHSARTNHTQFAESADEVRPLTEEERREQMLKLQEKLKRKKLERDANERAEELEREKKRREQGKNLVSAKQKYQEDEMKRIAEATRREKEEDRIYREKLKQEIARERAEKLARDRGEDPDLAKTAPAPTVTVAHTTASSGEAPTSCRLQMRCPSGPPLVHEFQPVEELSAVALYVVQNWKGAADAGLHTTDQVRFVTTFPKKTYTEDDFNSTLKDLGLCPSTALMVQIKK